MWHNIYMPTKNIVPSEPGENMSYIKVPDGDLKGCLIAVPEKLVRNTKKKTVKTVSFSEDFSFRVYSKENEYKLSLDCDKFRNIIADLHREGHAKFYGRR